MNSYQKNYVFNKVQSALFTFILVAIIGIMGVMFWLYNIEDNPPAFIQSPATLVEDRSYFPGDVVSVYVSKVCRFTYAPSTVYITYESANQFYPLAPLVSSGYQPHECQEKVFNFRLPNDLPPDTGYVRYNRVIFDINKLRTRELFSYTEPFDVVPRP